MSGVCVAEIPEGVQIRIVIQGGDEISGRVIKNYGACLNILTNSERIIGISNDAISTFEIVGKESIDAYRINQAKEKAKWASILRSIG